MNPSPADKITDVAVVAIGRNEGDRLRRCLSSVAGQAALVVYVDSGSKDGSVEQALARGARVVELDTALGFTAARARNAGFDALGAERSKISFVQFVDGDCEIESGWLATARDYLASQPDVAGVFGRRRERFPDASFYTRLCDEEWNVPAGVVKACGGDVMLRASAFEAVGGYRPGMIAGEEPELCVRLRRHGGKIVCLDAPMSIHDVAITHFSQWWRRAIRGGHAYAEGAHLHGAPPERHSVAASRRIWLWGAAVPAATVAAGFAFGPAGFGLALIYPLQVARLYFKRRRESMIPLLSAIFLVLGNFAEAIGQFRFHANRVRGTASSLIEYKRATG
jgi:GT2 family glycosyltransferase